MEGMVPKNVGKRNMRLTERKKGQGGVIQGKNGGKGRP